MILYTNKQSPRENYVCEMRIRDLRAKPKKRDSVPQCFVSRNMKRPGKCAGLFRETKRRRKSCFVSVVSFPTCFNSGPSFMAENETITQSTYKYANRRLQASRPPKSSTLTIVREALTTLI